MSDLFDAFKEEAFASRVRSKLPHLFQLAEIDHSRDGKIGMGIGSAREQILIAMLIYKFGSENVRTDIPIAEPEVDVLLSGRPISIKTISSPSMTGIKLIWTVDRKKAKEFIDGYTPSADMLLAHINWGGNGVLFLVPEDVQLATLKKIGKRKYFKLPRLGTNPRGVELSGEAARMITDNMHTARIEIEWFRGDRLNHSAYDRWVEYWREDS